jgi:hypothetical protein
VILASFFSILEPPEGFLPRDSQTVYNKMCGVCAASDRFCYVSDQYSRDDASPPRSPPGFIVAGALNAAPASPQ